MNADIVTDPEDLHHYAIPSPTDPGRWLVVVRWPWLDRWTPVLDCPSEAVARREAEARNPIRMPPPLKLRGRRTGLPALHDIHPSPATVQ